MASSTFMVYLNERPKLLPAILAGAVLCAGYGIMRNSAKRMTSKVSLPPGPTGLPLLGNAFDVPEKEFWLKYMEWSREYGSDVIYLNMLGTPFIVLNSLKATKELLETRSLNYSSRPNMPMMNDLIGFDWHFAFMEYGLRWKERRAMFSKVFHASQSDTWRPEALVATKKLLHQLLDEPDQFLEHARRWAGAFILNITYGLDIKSNDDIYILQAERGMRAMAAAATGSAYIVDFLPSLRYVPAWFPGATFQREAREWRKSVLAMSFSPFQYVKDALARGDAKPCAATRLLSELDVDEDGNTEEERESAVRDALASTYAAGSDTTVSTFATFVLVMLQHPDIQKKAQKVVDEAISLTDSLPDFSMYGELPYIEALVREVLRWRPVTPVAVVHQALQDDVYEDHYIPAGATVLANSWAILHDPEIYGPNTEEFNPGRFMDATETSINHDMPLASEGFGFGRRICPGMHIGIENTWLAVVSILATFDILPPPEGQQVETLGEYTSGLLIHPVPFKCRFVPRSELAVQAIRGH